MSRRTLANPASRIICQISGRYDDRRTTRLPAQCCGLPADQIYKCEVIAPPGHRCQVGQHTIEHERWGNGYSCAAIEHNITKEGAAQ